MIPPGRITAIEVAEMFHGEDYVKKHPRCIEQVYRLARLYDRDRSKGLPHLKLGKRGSLRRFVPQWCEEYLTGKRQ